MTAFLVFVPGTSRGYSVFAQTRAEAIADAVSFYGLSCAPHGTTAVPTLRPLNHSPDQLPIAA